MIDHLRIAKSPIIYRVENRVRRRSCEDVEHSYSAAVLFEKFYLRRLRFSCMVDTIARVNRCQQVNLQRLSVSIPSHGDVFSFFLYVADSDVRVSLLQSWLTGAHM